MLDMSYATFYRTFGIRRVENLNSPMLTSVANFQLPLSSFIHYQDSETEVGPTKDYFLLKAFNRGMFLNHVYKLSTLEGKPRNIIINYVGEIANYHRKNPRIKRLLKSAGSIGDPKIPVGTSYTGLHKLYKYNPNVYKAYYEWKNFYTTVWESVEATAKESNRNQFLVMELPAYVPTREQLKLAETALSQTTLKYFQDFSGFMLLDLWTWIGEKRKDSLMGKLSPATLEKVNLVFTNKGQVTVLNLGLFNSWRSSTESEKLADADSAIKGVEAETLQKRFLHFILTLKGIKLEEVVVEEEVAEEEAVAEATKERVAVSAKTLIDKKELQQAFNVDDDDVSIDDEKDAEESEDDIAVELTDSDIDADLSVHEEIVKAASKNDTPAVSPEINDIAATILAPTKRYTPASDALEDNVVATLAQLTEQGMLTLAEYRRLETMASRYKTMAAPDIVKLGMGKADATIADAINIKAEELTLSPTQFPDSKTVLDKSMLESTLNDYAPRYIKSVLHRDILGAVMAIQRTGIVVSDIDVVEKADALNHYYQYSVRLNPPAGKQTTVSFKIPVVTEEGTIISGGVNYYLKNQRGDVPIRKIGPARVALTSYYGKLFIDRSENATVNYGRWITNRIRALGMDNQSHVVTSMKMSDNFDKTLYAPRTYSAIASKFKSFVVKPVNGRVTDWYKFDFNHKALVAALGDKVVERVTAFGEIPVGVDQTGAPIGMSMSGMMTVRSIGGIKEIGDFRDILGIPSDKVPVEIAVVNVFAKAIPMAMVLGYQLGLNNLLDLLGVSPRIVERGKMIKRLDTEYVVQFKDYSLVFNKDDKKATMVIAGFRAYQRFLGDYKLADFNQRDVYINVLEAAGIGVRFIREIDLLFKMYLDDITRGLLTDMGEPTDMVFLLLRAAELLTVDKHPDEIDGRLTRYRGYERFAGTVYQEMIKACRMKAARPMSTRVGLEVNPEAVWQQILQDSAMEVTNDINPIQNLKQKEVVTFGGTGGRTADTMVKRTRIFHETDVGIISEATVDSGAVGVISYFSANPNLVDLRGRTKAIDENVQGLGSVLSTSGLLAPAITKDDPKRANFVNIQQSHGISSIGYKATPLRTGYEQVMVHRTDDLFAYTAKDDGKIIAKDERSMAIEYKNGDIKYIQLGRRFGKSAGSVVPHNVVSELAVGAKVKRGDLISYNTEYFEKDWMNPGKVAWRAGVMAKTLLMDTVDTFEDSSVISERLAGELMSKTTHIRHLVMDFDQAPHGLVSVGDKVDFESILCTIEDPVTAGANLFDESTIETLKLLSNAAPKAKYTGLVENIEVFYNGDVENMSDALQSLVMSTDRNMNKLYRNLGKPKITGRVDGTYRIEGNPLLKNQVVINVYITADVKAGVGDKGVFGNQLKTTYGRVMTGVNQLEDGTEIDAIFPYESISNRIVESPIIIGTTNTLLRIAAKRVVDIYKGEK